MFERYTEKARRTLFFARYEASQLGSPVIQPEHLLLGLLRDDKVLVERFLRSQGLVQSIRKQIENSKTGPKEPLPPSVDLPFSPESKRVLTYSAEEADRLSNSHIGTEHLLLALLREDKSLAAKLLNEAGINLESTRKELAQTPHEVGERLVLSFDLGLVVEHYAREHGALPKDLAELLARIMFIVYRREIAAANNETVKVRFYEDVERKEREKLRLFFKQHGQDR